MPKHGSYFFPLIDLPGNLVLHYAQPLFYVIASFKIIFCNIIELLYVRVQLPTRRGKRTAVYFGTPLKNAEIIKPLVIKRSYSMRFRFPTYLSSQAHFSFLYRRLLYNFSFAE